MSSETKSSPTNNDQRPPKAPWKPSKSKSAKTPSPLEPERAKASFSSRQLTFLLDGGREVTEKKEFIASLVAKNPVFSQYDRYFLSREEHFKKALEQSYHIFTEAPKLGLTADEIRLFIYYAGVMVPYGLNDTMFIPTLIGQANDEQKKKWLGPAMRKEILGAYAQTELGHGSNVRGLETVAVYDKEKQQFVLNSPTLTSLKWWPGALGKMATHCAAYARLVIDGKDYGVHSFIVQIRDENHNPLPGISVGDIGPKMGFNTVDNGYLAFENVRIPRENMLMRFSKVNADGSYVKPAHTKIGYATMLFVRANMIRDASDALARACTISVRYSAVRRQFAPSAPKEVDTSSQQEVQVLDYQQQQYSLFPLLASSFAFVFMSKYILDLFAKMQSSIKNMDFSVLPETHATTAGLKAVCTTIASDGIEECRRRCGGHGYSMFSGLPLLFANYVPATTYEGDNVVLLLQVARYLMKSLQAIQSGKKFSGNVTYLADKPGFKCPQNDQKEFLSFDAQVAIYAARARALVYDVTAKFQKRLSQPNSSYNDAWNSTMADFIRMAKAHSMYVLVLIFSKAVQNIEDRALKRAMRTQCDLFALYYIESQPGDFLEYEVITPKQLATIRSAVYALLAAVRPDAIALVDGFNFPDFLLNSALGRYDGKVYEHLFRWTQDEPLNRKPLVDGFTEFVKPMLNPELVRSRL